jgi:hypothetical protein
VEYKQVQIYQLSKYFYKLSPIEPISLKKPERKIARKLQKKNLPRRAPFESHPIYRKDTNKKRPNHQSNPIKREENAVES